MSVNSSGFGNSKIFAKLFMRLVNYYGFPDQFWYAVGEMAQERTLIGGIIIVLSQMRDAGG